MTRTNRIILGIAGFLLPALVLALDAIYHLVAGTHLSGKLTPLLFVLPFVMFGVAIFRSVELSVWARVAAFVAACLAFVVAMTVSGAILVVFTGLEGTQ